MQHTMAQDGWQAMIAKSARMFDALLRDFLQALLASARSGGAPQAHLSSLIARFAANDFYAEHLAA
jgi:hypothetical protein